MNVEDIEAVLRRILNDGVVMSHSASLYLVYGADGGMEYGYPKNVNDGLSRLCCEFGHEIGLAWTHFSESKFYSDEFWAKCSVPHDPSVLYGVGVKGAALRWRAAELDGGEISAHEVEAAVEAGKAERMAFVLFMDYTGTMVRLTDREGDTCEFVGRGTPELIAGGMDRALMLMLNALVDAGLPAYEGA